MGRAFNQTKQVYVATAYGDPLGNNAVNGTIQAKVSGDGSDIVLKYKDVKGQQTRSDIINVDNIMWVKAASAESQRDYINTWTITLNSNVNSGNVIAGKDYILRIKTSGYYDTSDINEYIKYGTVRGADGMTKSAFYKKMAISVAKNFSKEPDKPIKVFIGATEVTASMEESDIAGNATSLIIKEAKPFWRRNDWTYQRYNITVESGTFTDSTNTIVDWASIAKAVSTTEFFGNGEKTADLEDVSLTLHGDYVHGITYPLSSETMVDPTKEYNYLTIHHCHIGANQSPQKSEKDIVVVSEEATVINSIVTAINNATGKSFTLLTVESAGGGN